MFESFEMYGLEVVIQTSVQESMSDDPLGDASDGFLCAIQASWPFRQPSKTLGILPNVDAAEGWIVDPHPE